MAQRCSATFLRQPIAAVRRVPPQNKPIPPLWLGSQRSVNLSTPPANIYSSSVDLQEQDLDAADDALEVPELEEMQAYFQAVRHETLTYLKKLDAKGFEVCPPRTPYPESKLTVAFFQNFTVAHTFCQLIGETNQHLGQVAYIRGLQKNLDKS